MYWTEKVTLMEDRQVKTGGTVRHSYVPTRTVFADKRSVKYTEFAAEEQNGRFLTAVFVVHREEYRGERYLQHDGWMFCVVRPYQTGDGDWELSCEDKAVD